MQSNCLRKVAATETHPTRAACPRWARPQPPNTSHHRWPYLEIPIPELLGGVEERHRAVAECHHVGLQRNALRGEERREERRECITQALMHFSIDRPA